MNWSAWTNNRIARWHSRRYNYGIGQQEIVPDPLRHTLCPCSPVSDFYFCLLRLTSSYRNAFYSTGPLWGGSIAKFLTVRGSNVECVSCDVFVICNIHTFKSSWHLPPDATAYITQMSHYWYAFGLQPVPNQTLKHLMHWRRNKIAAIFADNIFNRTFFNNF